MKKILLLISFCVLVFSGENGFDLAPTPVSQNQISSGEVENRFKVTSISSSVNAGDSDFDISGVGAQFAKKDGKKDGALNMTGSLITLSGSGGGLDASLSTANVGLVWETYKKTLDDAPYTIFYGLDFSYSYLNAYNDNFEIDIYTTVYGGVGGVQFNIHSAEMIFSPFVMGKYLMGDYEADVWNGGYGYASGDIDPFFASSLGFDIYFKSLKGTLSAMIKNDENSNTTILSYAWYW